MSLRRRSAIAVVAVALLGIGTLSEPERGNASAVPAVASQAQTLGPRFRVDSPFVRDRAGRARFFHGVNAVWKRPPYFPPSTLNGKPLAESYFDERDTDFLADNGFNTVRLGSLYVGIEPTRDQFDEAYLDEIEKFVDMLAARDVTVMLDFHQDMWHERYEGEGFPDWATTVPATNCCGFPGNYFTAGVIGAFDRLWHNEDQLWTEFRDAWRHVADRFKDKPNLIGYDLLNEPWPGSRYESCINPQGCPTFDIEFLQPFWENTIAGIREVDMTNIIWWEPHVITTYGAENHVGRDVPIADPGGNQGISFHLYCLPEDDAATCASTQRTNVENQHEAAARNDSALFLTEFGATDELAELRRATSAADRGMVSWHYWAYGEWQDPTTTGTGGAQSLFGDDLDRFATLKEAKADVLIRPYPQAVAGTPLRFRFFPGRPSRLFRLAYRTRPSIDLPTIVFVPVARHYPEGYEVQLRGPARVISRRNAPLLRLRNTGRGTVELAIRARGAGR